MLAKNPKRFFLLVLILCQIFSKASSEGIKDMLTSAGMQCLAQYPLSVEEIQELKNKRLPESANCMIDCTLKKAQMTDNEGKLDVDHVRDLTRQLLVNEPDKLQQAAAVIDKCSYVNDEPVNDDCARAALIFNCVVEKAPQHGFQMM